MPVVEAVGVAHGLMGARDQVIEKAMFEAVQKAQAEGITDPDEIRKRILAARDAALEK